MSVARKSHTGFPLVQTWMILNDTERRNSPYFAFFSPNSTDFQAHYITVVEDRPIMSVKYCLPVPVFSFGQNYNAPSDPSVCLFVCLSRKICPDFYNIRKII